MTMMPDGEGKVLARLQEKGIISESILHGYEEGDLHIMKIGDQTLPMLLLIHGSPGDWSNWENIILDSQVRERYCILAVDRVGYGATTLKAESKLSDQTRPIWDFLDSYETDSTRVLAGHSYGGAVVEQMLIERPGYFTRAVFAAGTLSPDMQEPRWYNNFASLKLINKILPKTLKASNLEMVALSEALLKNEPKLRSISEEIIFIQGKKDVLVPYETMDYFKEYGPPQTQYIFKEKMNHFIPWSDPELIIDSILEQ